MVDGEEEKSQFEVTRRSKLKTHADRGNYTTQAAYDVLDECFMCFVSYLPKGGSTPVCIPQGCARFGDELIIHGKSSSSLMKYLAQGNEVCVTAARIHGIVCAKSAFSHSVNYKSVVLWGKAKEVKEKEEKIKIMNAFTDQLTYEGRSKTLRSITDSELISTKVVTLPIREASVKIRDQQTGEKEDVNVWSGIIPLTRVQSFGISDEISVKQGFSPPKLCLFKNKNEKDASLGASGTNMKIMGIVLALGAVVGFTAARLL